MTSNEPLRIDGAMGEGGGQVLRTSLALSMLTGRGVQVERIRSGRKKPGLLRQHLTAARAAVEISGGHLEGGELHSTELRFEPGEVRPGSYHFAIGTAGSTTLVLQTVLAPLMLASGPSTVVLEGGTHNPSSPPFDFLEHALLPLLGRMGPKVSARLERFGFFPAGGGRLVVEIEPVEKLLPLELHERGKLEDRSLRAFVAHLPDHVGERMIARFQKRSGWPGRQLEHVRVERSQGPGVVLVAHVRHRHVSEVITGFGRPRLPSETVADRVFQALRSYLKHGAPVGEHLADQLIVPLALAGGGGFTTRGLTTHAKTQIDLVGRFLEVGIEVEEGGQGVRVRFG